MADRYEKVHTMTDFYDGPRRGVADFEGRPHLYESQWDDDADNYASTFVLTPVNDDVFRLALEDWAIWRRWETAFHEGTATQETHPALPDDRERHNELQPILAQRLVADALRGVRALGEFRTSSDPTWNGKGFAPLEVRWERV
jgi:hypothetical protein